MASPDVIDPDRKVPRFISLYLYSRPTFGSRGVRVDVKVGNLREGARWSPSPGQLKLEQRKGALQHVLLMRSNGGNRKGFFFLIITWLTNGETLYQNRNEEVI